MAVMGLGMLAAVAGAQPAGTPRTAELKAAGGATIGSVSVTGAPNGVVVRVQASGLTPGWHGAHFHEKGDCSDAGFKASGSHVHTGKAVVHGLLNPRADDNGDLPNIHVATDGTANVELFTALVSLEGKGRKQPGLIDADGSALVIHAKADDHLSQPIGGAGDRVACAVIR
jgi:Cu-Zn family superoxide dismutase